METKLLIFFFFKKKKRERNNYYEIKKQAKYSDKQYFINYLINLSNLRICYHTLQSRHASLKFA